ncbi:MAG TPA: hypothetical protein VD997_11035 [Phycisphaerales bacterium]|nr:hypothetical protein [Phycisphaerales bacterium]
MRERLYRDASGHLTLDLDRDYPRQDVDIAAVKAVLEACFEAQFGRPWEDVLGDMAAQQFNCGSNKFELFWDHWLGLRIVSLRLQGDTLLTEMARYFEAKPPPLKPAPP